MQKINYLKKTPKYLKIQEKNRKTNEVSKFWAIVVKNASVFVKLRSGNRFSS